MAKSNLYQIYYNEETRASLDSGFIPLDNTTNLRPDWGEFFVIRHFLRNNPLNEDEKYGFFSPKFQQKTGLSSSQVHEFIESTPENTDVVIFSPFWEMISFFKNVFEQGNFWHPGLINISQNFFLEAGRYHEVDNLLMHRKNTVFCNYFAASPAFWRSWLKIGDLLFDYSEDKNHPLNLLLNQRTYHDNHD